MPAVLSRETGHNLLEVIIASFILSTVLIFVAGLWGVYHTALGKSKDMLVATSLARSVLEQKMAAGYAALDGTLGVPVTSQYVARSQIRGRPLQVQYEVTFVGAATAMPGIRRLTVTLAWEESTGPKTLSYETFLFRTQ